MENYKKDGVLEIDLGEVYGVLRKNAANIARVTGVCVAASLVYLLIASPVYESESLLRIKQPKGIGSSILESMPMGNSMASKQLMSTYDEILKSRSVVIPMIEQTEKKAVPKKFFGLLEDTEKGERYPDYEAYVKGRIKTVPVKDTEILKLTVNARTAEAAQKANTLLVESFLKRLTSLSREEQKQVKAFLEVRVQESKAELNKAEAAVNAFQKENKVIAPDAEVQIATEKMALTDKLKAENEVAAATGNARAAASAGQLQANGARIADNTEIAAYRNKLAALESQRIEYASKYTEKHPSMIKINEDIADLQQKLNAAIQVAAQGQVSSDNPVYNGVLAEQMKGEAEASIAKSNLAALQKVEDDFKEDIEKLSDTQREYVGLLRDRNVAQEIYVMLSKRLEEAKVAEAGVATEVQVVDTATLPDNPVKPKKRQVVLIAALLGMLLSGGFAVVRSLLNKTINSSEDVKRYTDLPVLAQIPDYNSMAKRLQREKEEQGFFDKLKGVLWK